MVSICGGEPLIYPKIEELVTGLLEQGRIVYICTNGMFMRKKMRDYLAEHLFAEHRNQALSKLLARKADYRKGRRNDPQRQNTIQRPIISPTKWMYWNVHIDGLEYTHDLIVEREGVFKECVEAIKMAKILGYQVATNTTVYKETDVKEIEEMFEYLLFARSGWPHDFARIRIRRREERHGQAARQTAGRFLPDAHHDPPEIREDSGMGRALHDLRHAGLPGISRRQTRVDLHRLGHPHPQHSRLESAVLPDDRRPLSRVIRKCSQKVDWDKYGVVDGVARDPRCENCMVHCGYDPSGALGTNYKRGDNWKNFKYNFGAKPKPYYEGRERAGVQWRFHRQRPPGRSQGGD